jgi:hypothetical protein
MTAQAQARWNLSAVNDNKHIILAIIIMNSITNEFLPTLLNHIPHLLCNDGTYLQWSLSHNIHQNNVSFTEHISEKIRLATLSQFNNDVTNYIVFIKDNLCMIINPAVPTTEHIGLITYILWQLKDSAIYMFQKYVWELHVDYQEAKLGDITITKLILHIEDKIHVLKHAGGWIETNNAQL